MALPSTYTAVDLPAAIWPLLGMGVFLLRAGQIVYAAGLSRAKNSAGVLMRGIINLSLGMLIFWAVGAALLFQHGAEAFRFNPRLLAGGLFGFADRPIPPRGHLLVFAIAISVASGTACSALAERIRVSVVVAITLILCGFVVPVAGSWAAPNGWLGRLGFVDSAGASWIYLSSGIFALVGLWFAGSRRGKYHRDGSSSMIPGHSLPMAGLGLLMMTAGWIAYIAAAQLCFGILPGTASGVADAITAAAYNTLLAGAAGATGAMLISQYRQGVPDFMLTKFGFLGGLVSMTAAGGVVSTAQAVVIGAVAGALVSWASIWLDLIAHLDDPVSAIATNGVGGLWGALAAGIFAPGSLVERLRHTGVQLLGIVCVTALSAACALALFRMLRGRRGLRPSEADEYDGLDLAEHNISAYPDFQQNTIRSYHLREA